jgi:hypothetical protein
MMSGNKFNSIILVLAAAILLGLISTSVLGAQTIDSVDPFYENLLEQGRVLYQNSKPAEVIENLEIAFFGFLDHPNRLLECYVYLAVCQFQQKNYEKAKYYVLEIKKLKLESRMAEVKLPEDLTKKYAEISPKLVKS